MDYWIFNTKAIKITKVRPTGGEAFSHRRCGGITEDAKRQGDQDMPTNVQTALGVLGALLTGNRPMATTVGVRNKLNSMKSTKESIMRLGSTLFWRGSKKENKK